MIELRTLSAAEIIEHLPALVSLLLDSVESGASVGYLPPLAREDAEQFWREAAADEHRIVIAAFDQQPVGCVQLALATKANGAHRAEVQKLMVHTSQRGRGIAPDLMRRAEEEAASRGRSTLVLDTRKGDTAEKLYQRLGYIRAGEIPRYARGASGDLHATVFFYKLL